MSLSLSVGRCCLFLLVFGGFVPRALAGFGVCQPGWEWANNSMNQNPCEIAGALDAQCGGYSTYVVGPLTPNENYFRPQTNDTLSQNCNCNTVMYSLYMACTGCQNASIQTWQFWRFYCDAVYITQYPNIIPYTTAVPHWAYLNYTVGGTFDPVLAKAAGGPESLSPVPPTLSTSVSPAHTDPPTTTQGNDNGNGGKKSSHVGAIVGGVIGGLAALAVIGATWMFLRKRAAAHGDEDYPDYTKVYPGGVSSSEHAHEIPPSQPRLYDPSDPSTYPSHIDHVSSVPYTTVPQSGRYSGVPEL